MQMLGTWLVAFQDIRADSGRNPIGRRTESDRTADGIRSDGERNPIGQRTESDRAANGNRSGGGRNLIGRRTEHDALSISLRVKKLKKWEQILRNVQ